MEHKKIPLWQVVIVFACILLSLCWGRNVFGNIAGGIFGSSYGETHITLVVSIALASIVAVLNGYKWTEIEKGMYSAVHRALPAILILAVVGILIGSWMAGGIVPTMIYYGLMILKPSVFYLASCLICAIVSLAVGSSWTTAGTVGVALIGISGGLGMNPAITAGAIVSGSYFGDKMSPFSDTTNVSAAAAGTNLYDHIKHMMYTVVPGLAIALVLYGLLGIGNAGKAVDISAIQSLQENLAANFRISPLLLLPPVIVIITVILKVPAIPGLMLGALLGCICAVSAQGVSIGDLPTILHYGFTFPEGADVLPEVSNLCERGGLDSMLWTISLLMIAMCLGGVLESTGMLTTMAEALLKMAKTDGLLVLVTVITNIMMNMFIGDSCLSSIVVGKMYREEYEKRGLMPENLSRTLEDSGTMMGPLIPWNSCGATMSSFLGVATLSYTPYAFLNLLSPAITLFYGFTGITIKKIKNGVTAAPEIVDSPA